MNCHACGTSLSGSARFCHKCGAAVAAGPATAARPAAAWQIGLPWGVAGAAVGALITVLAMRTGGAPSDAAPPTAPFAAGAPGQSGGAPDISQMSPEERATRLFNRVMRLAEENKTDSMRFFLPMALQSYSQLPALDVDARYHVGVLELAAENAAGALAQADSIRRSIPNHLFGFILRARAYQQRGEARNEQQAFRDFLRVEAAERARQRPEYADHAQTLDAFSAEAKRAAGGASGR